ncbi:glucose-6-phosphate dehydrogenase assembly protein OpcA [Opitutus terrae]|uniref:Glucose-6-phosphate dehydrogenase n=1 Tax=Opitutus terrae (strain DSM 11246 / JCM 15787 / PB90-1) TaxID=452637 RepID=B1ZZA9_OPITP|nr:glucose-6-phosphate dehydrogenase assembly protein OpcA [Opitutus terrae]ACB77181.1 hypothetical protein Oter_3907 [Opitutus terrae PB90-1]
MPEVFNALPGIEVPVGAISRSLTDMWDRAAAEGRGGPNAEDVKATQVNFVLHLGFNTTTEDAVAQFQTLLRFSQRYPSRVVMLCPLRHDQGATEMRAKIYGECFLGKSKDDTRCVEFVMLSYPMVARQYLENQVSVCLSTDLPLYYWPHRFSDCKRLADYTYLLTRAKRVLIDSAIAPFDTFVYPWPKPESLRDLVDARLLPVRQTVGQFLARFPAENLVADLTRVVVLHAPGLGAEACETMGWLRQRLEACGADVAKLPFSDAKAPAHTLGVRFEYASPGKYFRWNGDLAAGHALFEADFGTGRTTLPAPAGLLSPELALSEAMFF